MIDWLSLTETELAYELRGVANGARDESERSRCGRFLIARLPPAAEPYRSPRWELWKREGDSWRVLTTHAWRQRARMEAERLAKIEAERGARA